MNEQLKEWNDAVADMCPELEAAISDVVGEVGTSKEEAENDNFSSDEGL